MIYSFKHNGKEPAKWKDLFHPAYIVSVLFFVGLLTLGVVSSCDIKNEDGTYKLEKDPQAVNYGGFYQVVIDSCEYVASTYQLAHKGSCKYCAERRKKELEEILNSKEQ